MFKDTEFQDNGYNESLLRRLDDQEHIMQHMRGYGHFLSILYGLGKHRF